MWAHKFPGSERFVKHLIKTDLNLGAFSTSTGELCAWILRYPTGILGMLQVTENFSRKGLGKHMMIAMTKLMAENGLDSSGIILKTNTASRNLCQSVGYQELYEVFYYISVD